MTRLFDSNKNILFIGAHPDDLIIGTAGIIHRNNEKAHILTVTDGAPLSECFYPMIDADNVRYYNPISIGAKKLEQDLTAIKYLGVKPWTYVNLGISDQTTHKNIDIIIDSISNICTTAGIDAIVTHEFPQGHSDHEVVNFCSQYAGMKKNIPVYEYPMYATDNSGNIIFKGFIGDTQFKADSILLDENEFAIKITAMKCYRSELSYLKNLSKRESVRKTTRTIEEYFDPKNHSDYIKWIIETNPESVREAFKEFLSTQEK